MSEQPPTQEPPAPPEQPLPQDQPPQAIPPTPPPPSPTATIPEGLSPEQRAELQEKLQQSMAEAYDLLMQLHGDYKPVKHLDPVRQALENIRDQLGPTDTVMFYDIGLFDKDHGLCSRIRGSYIMHFFTDQRHIAESPRNMEAVMYSNLFRPLKSEGDKYLNGHVSNTNPIQGAPAFANNDPFPKIPDSRPVGWLAEP